MRLGLTGASYNYLFGGGVFPDRTSGQYDWRGLVRPYFTSTPTILPPQGAELWQIERARQLDLPVVHRAIADWSPQNIDMMRQALAQNSQELMPVIGFDMMAQGTALEEEIARAIDQIRRYAEFGGISVSKLYVTPMVHNRFQKDPGLREQLDRMIAALPPVVRAAEQAGIVLALENHLDYRVAEIVEVIEAVGSDHLRLLFDMGNPFAVCEDPLEAAKIAAPYTALVHLKDVVVLPFTPATPGYFACMYVCPLGEGNIDIRGIVDVLSVSAPNPDALTLSIEMSPVAPHIDEDLWVQKGIQWMRDHLSDYISETPRTAAAK